MLEERRGDHAPGEASEIVESAAVSTVHRRGDVRDRSPHVDRRASDEKRVLSLRASREAPAGSHSRVLCTVARAR